jgi:hypothetical protein
VPYKVGQVITLKATFKRKGLLVDPTSVTMNVLQPGGQSHTYTYGETGEIIRVSEGCYEFDLAFTLRGKWEWGWRSYGTGAGAESGAYDVA